ASARPATAPVALCASAGARAMDERQTPIAMQSTDLRKLRVLLISSPRCSWLLWRGYEVVVPLVEVQVAAVPFDFPALQVHRLGTEMGLCRLERPAVVVVEGDAPCIEAAQVKAGDRGIGVVEAAESDIHRHPAMGCDVQLAPV